MNEPIKISKLPAKDRPLARRCRTWEIHMLNRRGGILASLKLKRPGPPSKGVSDQTGDFAPWFVGMIVGRRALPNMSRAEQRKSRKGVRS